MSQWNPAQHPRDPNNGQFTENWIGAVSAQLPGGEDDGGFDADERNLIERMQKLAGSRSLRHDISTWSLSRLKETRDDAAGLLSQYVSGVGRLTDDEDEDLSYIVGAMDSEFEQRKSLPPWEGGPPDPEGRHYEAWVSIVKAEIAKYGFNPDSEMILNAIPWDDTGHGSYYHEMMDEDPTSLVTMEVEAFRDDYSEQDVRSAYNAIGVYNDSMDSYDHPGAKTIKAWHLVEHPDFAESTEYEVFLGGEWLPLHDTHRGIGGLDEFGEQVQDFQVEAGGELFDLNIGDDIDIRRVAG